MPRVTAAADNSSTVVEAAIIKGITKHSIFSENGIVRSFIALCYVLNFFKNCREIAYRHGKSDNQLLWKMAFSHCQYNIVQ